MNGINQFAPAKSLECGDLVPLSQLCNSQVINRSLIARFGALKLGKRHQVAALQRLRRYQVVDLIRFLFAHSSISSDAASYIIFPLKLSDTKTGVNRSSAIRSDGAWLRTRSRVAPNKFGNANTAMRLKLMRLTFLPLLSLKREPPLEIATGVAKFFDTVYC